MTSRTAIALRIPTGLLAGVLVASSMAGPGQPGPELACAAYDHHLLMLVEDQGLRGDGDPEILASAVMRILDARVACRAGDYERGLKLYESIGLDPAPIPSSHRVLLR
ncbi:hypothetical protein [Microvirga massiliensis]|uniref:hypothetical protein n=1 Tax=Microvirga massiliensis TaxID=1033741 RepID=UPI00062B7D86|nr:hypothetical protein [Microvirga massiliensis]